MLEVTSVSSDSRANRTVVEDRGQGRRWDEDKRRVVGRRDGQEGSGFSGMTIQPYMCTEFERGRHSSETSNKNQRPKWR